MNVLVISEPGSSGVFTYVEALCHHLVGRGVSVHLGYSDRRGSDRLEALVRHVEGSGGLTVNMEVGSRVAAADLRAFGRLFRLARRVRPDVVHCHSSKAGVLGRALALAGIRAAFVYHPHAYYGMRPERRPLDLAYDALEAIFGLVGTTITVSADEWKFAADRLGIPASKLRLIPNGVDPGRFNAAPLDEKLALRAAFGIPADRTVLGTISRMSLQKDPATLYRAFAAAAKDHPDLHLLHVGSGELEGEVDRILRETGMGDRVTRLAYLNDSTVFYKAVDGFILTSTYEGLSLAALEAVSSNLPVILSRAPGNIDLLELPLSHAWGADPGNVEQFSRCISLWRASDPRWSRPNHRGIARSRFDFRDAQDAVLALYEDRVAAGRRLRKAWAVRLPALAWIAVICFESTDRFTRANTEHFLYPIVHFLTGVGHKAFYVWNFYIRKTGHFVGYGTLCLLLNRLARFEFSQRRGASRSPVPAAAAAFLGTMIVSALDEWHQTGIPGRTGTVDDFYLDSAAGLAALGLIFILTTVRRPGGRDAAPPDPDSDGPARERHEQHGEEARANGTTA